MGMAIVLAVGFGLATASGEPVVLPDWMAGCWAGETEKAWFEECWTPVRGGIMLGTNRTGKRGDSERTANWEMMQIGPVEPEVESSARGLAFRASLQGGPWTTFAQVPTEEPGVTFVNAAHDYPQRIRYWREGDVLKAEIASADGSRRMQWTFRKAN